MTYLDDSLAHWDALDPSPDTPCLFSQGFHVQYCDSEGIEEGRPHLVLSHSTADGQSRAHFEVSLYLGQYVSRHALAHPSTHAQGKLVDILAHHLTSARASLDAEETLPVQGPLPVYVLDATWKPVVDQFIAKYG